MRIVALALMLILGLPVAASATTVVKLDFNGLVKASDAVVVGQIATVEAVEQDGRVFTRVRVKVEETLKGTHRADLTILHIGGRTEKLATRVSGMPSFTVGERALLFLEQPRGVAHFVVTGLAQGKMALRAREDGRLEILPNTKALHTVDMPTKTGAPVLTPPAAVVTLEDARARIVALSRESAE